MDCTLIGVKETLDVFSDASQHASGKCAGAYVVGRTGKPVGVILACKTNIEAEILAMIAGLEAAMVARKPNQQIVVHSDLSGIKHILKKGRGPAARLRLLLEKCGGKILPDAKGYKQYRRCHVTAQVFAGCRGSQHPLLFKTFRQTG